MNSIGTTSVAFVSLSALFWSGWVIGSSTNEGQEALADAYQSFKQDQTTHHEQTLFADDALRAIVCGVSSGPLESKEPKPCLAVAVANRLFIVDAGSGAAVALERKGIPLNRLEAVLLTGADPVVTADLDELWSVAAPQRHNRRLPVYGPTESHRVVQGLNDAMGVGPASGLEPWAPAPEPGKNVIVYEDPESKLMVSAFTTLQDAYSGRVGYRFDYRGRSLVVTGDGGAQWAEAAQDADVVLQGGSEFAKLHQPGSSDLFAGLQQFAQAAASANAGTLVLTDAGSNPILTDMQVRQAKSQGVGEVITARLGMVLELPLENRDVKVRAL